MKRSTDALHEGIKSCGSAVDQERQLCLARAKGGSFNPGSVTSVLPFPVCKGKVQ